MLPAKRSSAMETVLEITRDLRAVHEKILTVSDITGTGGTCLYGAFLLSTVLEKFGDCTTRVCGGDGREDGGAVDPQGIWHGHYWVEGKTNAGEEFAADVTADQFGWEKIVVLPIEEARARYKPGNDMIVQAAVDDLESQLAKANAVCILEPRGDYGLEGYSLGETYRFEHRKTGATDGKPYYRVWPTDNDEYYETCSPSAFLKHFKPVA
jgi:hypothetical protein